MKVLAGKTRKTLFWHNGYRFITNHNCIQMMKENSSELKIRS